MLILTSASLSWRARVADVLVVRVESHEDLIDIAERSMVPVVNGGTDMDAPCQVPQ